MYRKYDIMIRALISMSFCAAYAAYGQYVPIDTLPRTVVYFVLLAAMLVVTTWFGFLNHKIITAMPFEEEPTVVERLAETAVDAAEEAGLEPTFDYKVAVLRMEIDKLIHGDPPDDTSYGQVIR